MQLQGPGLQLEPKPDFLKPRESARRQGGGRESRVESGMRLFSPGGDSPTRTGIRAANTSSLGQLNAQKRIAEKRTKQPKGVKNQLNIAGKLLMMQEAQLRESADNIDNERVKEKPLAYSEPSQVPTSFKTLQAVEKRSKVEVQ